MRARSGRRAGLPLLAVVIASLSVHAVAAPFLQAGYDAARTGATPDAGPETDDVAFTVRLPGSRSAFMPPLILDDAIFVLTSDQGYGDALRANALFRIELADANGGQPLVTFPAQPLSFASDGTYIYVVTGTTIGAYAVSDGAKAWILDLPQALVERDPYDACNEPTINGGTLYVGCSGVVCPTPEECADVERTARSPPVVLAAYDLKSRSEKWHWFKSAEDEAAPGAPPAPDPVSASHDVGSLPQGVAAGGDHVFFVTRQISSDGINVTLWALGEADGAVSWKASFSQLPPPTLEPSVPSSYSPAVTPSTVYMKLGNLFAFNAARGNEIWHKPIGSEDVSNTGYQSGFALAEGSLYVASFQTLYRFSPENGDQLWAMPLLSSEDGSFGSNPMILAGSTLYNRAALEGESSSTNLLLAVDVINKTELWRHRFNDSIGNPSVRHFDFAIGEGVAVVAGLDGSVTVLGKTAASIKPALNASSIYPPVGSAVVVDLAATGAGVNGPVTSFRADWGDGTTSDWQPSPRFEHAYSSAGDFVARFGARNDAGQTASEALTLHVGGSPPVEAETKSPVQTVLEDPAQQNVILFLAGLVITLAGALIGLLALRKKRLALRREIDAVEEAFAKKKDDPEACISALEERRAHVRKMLRDVKLDEAQLGIVEKRIDELVRTVRVSHIEEQFQFLPMSMVKSLKAILEDSHVSALEHEHFIQTLDRDATLTADYKARIRRLIDEWFEEDRRSAAGGPDKA